MNQQTSELGSIFEDGATYDLVAGEIPYGLDYYVDLARESSGPVLDVACGTGRILLPSLGAGVEIEGLDLYQSMLDQLRKKAGALGLSPQLHLADMKQFQLGKQFQLVINPFNAFIHNMNQQDQISCLQCCHNHLAPGGKLVLDTFFPSLEIIGAEQNTRVLEGELPHPETGETLRMFDTRSFDRVEQVQHSLNEIERVGSDGSTEVIHRSRTSGRFIYKQEMALLLRVAGFDRYEIHGDFEGNDLQTEDSAMIVTAWK